MSIPKEVIESFLVDRAMRQLSPEAETLLQEYLRQNPASLESAQDIERIIETAGKAFADDPIPTCSLPDLRVRWTFGSSKVLRQLLSLAASLLIGFWAGYSFLRTETPPLVKIVNADQPPSPVVAVPQETGLSFWSLPTNLKVAETSNHSGHIKVNWNLSTLTPNIEGNP